MTALHATPPIPWASHTDDLLKDIHQVLAELGVMPGTWAVKVLTWEGPSGGWPEVVLYFDLQSDVGLVMAAWEEPC